MDKSKKNSWFMLAFCMVVAVCGIVFFVLGTTQSNSSTNKIKNTDQRVAVLDDDMKDLREALTALAESGFITDTQAKSLIASAVSGLLDSSAVNALIDAALSNYFTKSEINDLIATAIEGKLDVITVNALIDAKLNELLATDIGLVGTDAYWVHYEHKTDRFFYVEFEFDASVHAHLEIITLTIYNGAQVVAETFTTPIRAAVATILSGNDYLAMLECGYVGAMLGKSGDCWVITVGSSMNFCEVTHAVIQVKADHRTFTTQVAVADVAWTHDTWKQIENNGHVWSITTVVPTCKHVYGLHGNGVGYDKHECVVCVVTEYHNFTPVVPYDDDCLDCRVEAVAAAIAKAKVELMNFATAYLTIVEPSGTGKTVADTINDLVNESWGMAGILAEVAAGNLSVANAKSAIDAMVAYHKDVIIKVYVAHDTIKQAIYAAKVSLEAYAAGYLSDSIPGETKTIQDTINELAFDQSWGMSQWLVKIAAGKVLDGDITVEEALTWINHHAKGHEGIILYYYVIPNYIAKVTKFIVDNDFIPGTDPMGLFSDFVAFINDSADLVETKFYYEWVMTALDGLIAVVA